MRLSFGGKIKTLRRAKRWTMSEAAKASGMTEDQWENLESGKHEPLAGTLVKAMAALGASLDVFDPEDFRSCP